MPRTIGYSFGDTALLPFPFTDQSSTKKRPAVVVSSEAYNRSGRDVIVMAVTSQASARATIGESAVEGWKEAGLLKASVVKPVLATIDRGLILRKLGSLRNDDCRAVRRSLSEILGG